ncbi:hypothetical protein F3W84_17610 [Ochrobactrum quorumnocens]|uniref:Uncharacterized protein n=1 Tax=Ochrobactrum quorumnocens TaxID=271865 RepID=A0A5N1JVJ7_9HYPH|nr:hypothetical protein F3W84_17610 [[Ochrobactrum] quorumnocens]
MDKVSYLEKNKSRRNNPAALERFRLQLNSWDRSNHLFLRVIRRKTASRFCWKRFTIRKPDQNWTERPITGPCCVTSYLNFSTPSLSR